MAGGRHPQAGWGRFAAALRAADRVVAVAEGWVVTLLITAMLLLAVAQVAARNLGQTAIPGADTLLRHAVLWVGFLGAALAAHEGRHIHIDVGVRLLPAAWHGPVERLFDLVTAAICLLLARAAWRFLLLDYEGGTRLVLGIPAWALEVVLPAAFLLLAFHFLVRGLLGREAAAGPKAAVGEGLR
ncbi:MAG: TRAP transporter small permease [Nitrospirae bacterium]|nr:MAG: TRAP transporter small permease [Nitrospirota bacterium]